MDLKSRVFNESVIAATSSRRRLLKTWALTMVMTVVGLVVAGWLIPGETWSSYVGGGVGMAVLGAITLASLVMDGSIARAVSHKH